MLAHPRSRGEHPAAVVIENRGIGSSPLARGTSRGYPLHTVPERLIPARAGNISLSHIIREPIIGSSPLARGTCEFAGHGGVSFRLIPARAGNILRWKVDMMFFPAHPRSRGEHVGKVRGFPSSSGSSPLARGTSIKIIGDIFVWRLIPARAGNINSIEEGRGQLAAHPRSRGEHAVGAVASWTYTGSSPLARGTYLLTWGFIPYISKIESL